MVNEIDGYKAPTEPQSSRPLPACWMVKEIGRYGGAQVQLYRMRDALVLARCASDLPEQIPSLALRASVSHAADGAFPAARSIASNLIHHRASSKGSAPRGAQVRLASNLVHHRASSKGSEGPWPSRPSVNKTGMNQNSRQQQFFISLAYLSFHKDPALENCTDIVSRSYHTHSPAVHARPGFPAGLPEEA